MQHPKLQRALCHLSGTCVWLGQVVKSDSATASIPELEFEIPAATQRGCITTVEGLLREAGSALRELQPQRREHDAATAAAIDAFLGARLQALHHDVLRLAHGCFCQAFAHTSSLHARSRLLRHAALICCTVLLPCMQKCDGANKQGQSREYMHA